MCNEGPSVKKILPDILAFASFIERLTMCNYTHHYDDVHYHTIHLWTLIALAMGVLAESERTYLGDDLAEVNLPGY